MLPMSHNSALTVRITAGLHHRLRLHCATVDDTLMAFVASAIAERLASLPPEARANPSPQRPASLLPEGKSVAARKQRSKRVAATTGERRNTT